MTVPVITVDGPSGVGKGTVCGHLSKRLGFHLLDSGSLYRLTGLAVRQAGAAFDNPFECGQLAAQLDARFEYSGALQVFLQGENVTQVIRTEQASQDASVVAAIPEVRDALMDWQRNAKRGPGLIADGRDMGTAVFPDAGLKIYLDASSEERARRRYLQLRDVDKTVTLAAILRDLESRDRRDSERQASPLRAASDARVLDTSDLDQLQMLALIDQWVDAYLQEFEA